MKKSVALLLFLSFFLTSFAEILDPINWSYNSKKINENTIEVTFTAAIDAGWHLYGLKLPDGGPMPTKFSYGSRQNIKAIGSIQAKSKLIEKYDDMFELELNWYVNTAVFVQEFKITGSPYKISGQISYMGCNDENCINPEPYEFEIKGIANINETQKTDIQKTTPGKQSDNTIKIEPVKIDTLGTLQNSDSMAANLATNNDYTANTQELSLYKPVISELNNFAQSENATDKSLLIIFLLGLLGGFVALLTPCVWPLIPMTVSFFLKRNNNAKAGRRDAVFYGLSIVVIYLVLGIIITLIFGPSALNDLATSALFNVFFFLLLVLFAISFFGAFELTLPSKFTNKIDQKADNTTGILSILLMAFTLTLVSFSCTGPIIGTLLVQVASTGSLLGPAVGMFGFALALALPFSLFAFFPTWLKSLPKSGGWLNSVKVVLGFLELALSLKFLSVADLAYGWHILDREVFIVLWVVIFALLGMYLLGKLILPHDDKIEKVSVTRLMLAIISFAFALYLVPGLWGAPLRSVSAFAPPLYTQDFNLYQNEVHADFDNFEEGMQYAKQHNKPVIIDFSGFGCVNCRKMEAAVWTNDKVADILNKDYILISLMVDDKTALMQPITVNENGKKRILKTIGDENSYIQRYIFGANAQPFYVIVDANGQPLNSSYGFDKDPKKFIEYLKTGLSNYKKKK